MEVSNIQLEEICKYRARLTYFTAKENTLTSRNSSETTTESSNLLATS